MRWAEYEELTRERLPPVTRYRPPDPPRARIAAEICEWIARHCLLALLLASVAIACVYLFLDSLRK